MSNLIAPSRSLASVDPVHPINWDNPLTAGLRMWWKPLPGYGTLNNPCNLARITPITSGTMSGQPWHVRSEGICCDFSDHFSIGYLTLPAPCEAVDGFTWMQKSQAGQVSSGMFGKWATPKGVLVRKSSGNFQFYIRNSANTAEAGASGSIAWSGVRWFGGVADGTQVRTYLDGQATGATASLAGPYIPTGQPDWGIGGTYGDADYDCYECMAFDRALTAGEMWQWHDESKRGYPTILNRRRQWFPATVAVQVPTTTRLIGAGIL